MANKRKKEDDGMDLSRSNERTYRNANLLDSTKSLNPYSKKPEKLSDAAETTSKSIYIQAYHHYLCIKAV